MSELMNNRRGGVNFRWHLLASVSAAALVASAGASNVAYADNDADRPTVWIELGGQLERSSGNLEPFAPPFVAKFPASFFSPSNLQKPPLYSYGGEGAISFEPTGSDWTFSASVRYGRSNSIRQKHQQTPNQVVHAHVPTLASFGFPTSLSKYPSSHVKFADALVKQSESHAVLDFQAGKDVGLGMFGRQGVSVISAGVRIAQFNSKQTVSLHAEPDVHYTPSKPITTIYELAAFHNATFHFHDYAALASSERSFRGIGPSLNWNASIAVAGNPASGQMTIDWGANAAVLFGRQKVSGHHQTTARTYHKSTLDHGKTVVIQAFSTVSVAQHSNAAALNRARTVIVPDLGGFAGFSYRFPNAKLSMGYRADFFFGAMDAGLDVRSTSDVGFHGPFATISIGLP